nr:hypothetical protein Iba_chr02eCG8140 [Ipomoea batatas]
MTWRQLDADVAFSLSLMQSYGKSYCILGNLERKEILGDSFVDGNERDEDLNKTTERLRYKAGLRLAIPAMAHRPREVKISS